MFTPCTQVSPSVPPAPVCPRSCLFHGPRPALRLGWWHQLTGVEPGFPALPGQNEARPPSSRPSRTFPLRLCVLGTVEGPGGPGTKTQLSRVDGPGARVQTWRCVTLSYSLSPDESAPNFVSSDMRIFTEFDWHCFSFLAP